MIPSARAVPVLQGLAALAFAVGVGARLLPLGPAPTDAAPPEPSPVAALATAAPPTDPTSLVDLVIAQNIFSATRSAPRTRWSPPGLEPPSVEGAAPDTLAPLAMADSLAEADPVPALFGTVTGGGAPRALLRLDADEPAPRLRAVGDTHAGWRVVRIEPRRVVLRGPDGGTRTLVLRTPEER